MITAEVDSEGNHNVLLTMKSPSVYLDTCAIRILSEDTKMGQRFIDALLNNNGTLLVSYINAVEIGRMTHSLQPIQKFLEQIGPAWFPIDCNPVRVMEREDNGSAQPPCLDSQFGGDYYCYTHEHPTLSKLIDSVNGDKVKYDALHAMVAPQAVDIMHKRKLFKSRAPGFNQAAYLTPTFDPLKPTTYVYHGLMRYVFESDMKIEANDIFDIWHCTTPIAYANFIVTDKAWCNIARTRLKKMPWDNGKWIFSPQEIDNFLCGMEHVTFKAD